MAKLCDYQEINEVQRELLKRRIIDIVGFIDEDMAMYVRAAIMTLIAEGSPNIAVTISSSGGRVDWGLDIYDMLRLYAGKKTARVLGGADSMAAVVLQACDWRECARHSEVTIHYTSTSDPISLSVLQKPKSKKYQEAVDCLKKGNARTVEIIRQRTGKSLGEILRVYGKNKRMTAEEAIEFGLIDEII